MKKNFFIFSLLLVSGLYFANNSEPIEKKRESIKNEKNSLKTVKSTFFNDSSLKKISITKKSKPQDPFTNCVNSNTILYGLALNYNFELGNTLATFYCYDLFFGQ